MGGFAWVTLATNDSYSLGALVLAHSLRQANTAHQLAVLVTPGVTSVMREKLASVFNVVFEVNILDSKDEANLRLLKRPELGITFTKLHCWRLTQFEKCVFLDADTMVLANADELFDKEEFSAAPDVGWPDCFNSGVFVFRPSEETYNNLVQFALERGSFDGGDQGLLNLYFSDWAHKDISKHLPFIYNTCSTACYSYLPAFKQFGGNVKIIHFIGNSKPWLQYFDSESRQVHVGSEIQHLQVIVQQWWNIFCSFIHPILSPEMAGLAGAFARLTLGVPRTAEQAMLEDQLRRQGWEVGNIDYLGRDSFDNIWSKICETLNTSPAPSQVVLSQEPQQALPVEEVKQAASLIVETPADIHEEVQKIIPKPSERVAAEEIKSPVEGITDSKSQVTQISEDTQTQTSIPDSSTLVHTETQSQQRSIPLQEEHKEMRPASESVISQQAGSGNNISLETDLSNITSASQKPEATTVQEKSVAVECPKVPEQAQTPKPSFIEETVSAPQSQISVPHTESSISITDAPKQIPTTQIVANEPSSLPKESSVGAVPPKSVVPELQKPAPKDLPLKSESAKSSEPIVEVQRPKTMTSDSPSTPTPHKSATAAEIKQVEEKPVLSEKEASPQAPIQTPKPTAEKSSEPSGGLQKPKTTIPDHSTTTPAPPKPAAIVVSKQVVEKPVPSETSAPARASVEAPKSTADLSKPIGSSTPSKTEPEKLSTQSGKAAAAKPAPVKPSEPTVGDAGPTPPPRKAASGGGTGSKKPTKGKK